MDDNIEIKCSYIEYNNTYFTVNGMLNWRMQSNSVFTINCHIPVSGMHDNTIAECIVVPKCIVTFVAHFNTTTYVYIISCSILLAVNFIIIATCWIKHCIEYLSSTWALFSTTTTSYADKTWHSMYQRPSYVQDLFYSMGGI